MAYQINLTGKEIDERLQNVGTAEDVAAADGTLYARIKKNADDIAENKENVKALIKRVDVVTGTANGAEALAKVNEKRLNTVTGTANAAWELAQKNQFNLRQVQATANTALKNSEVNQDSVRNAQITANEAKALVEGLTTVVRGAENDISQLKELNVVYPNNIRTLTTESTAEEVRKAFIPAINGSAGTVNTPHVGYLIKGNRNSDNDGYDPDSTIISVEVVKIDDKDCHKFMYIDNNRDLVTMTVCIWGGTFKVIERSVVSNIDTVMTTLTEHDARQTNIEEVVSGARMEAYFSLRFLNLIVSSKFLADIDNIKVALYRWSGKSYSNLEMFTKNGKGESQEIINYGIILKQDDKNGANIRTPYIHYNDDATEESLVDAFKSAFGRRISYNKCKKRRWRIQAFLNNKPITAPFDFRVSIGNGPTSLTKEGMMRSVPRTSEVVYDGFFSGESWLAHKKGSQFNIKFFSNEHIIRRFPTPGDPVSATGETYGAVVAVKDNATAMALTHNILWTNGIALYEIGVLKGAGALSYTCTSPAKKLCDDIYDYASKMNSGTLRDLYVSAGAKYNEATGFYELNGLTDITEEEMRVIWQEDLSGWYQKGRTNLTRNIAYKGTDGGYSVGQKMSNICNGNANLEVFNLGSDFYASYSFVAFSECTKLKEVSPQYKIIPYSEPLGYNIFRNCPALQEVRFNMQYVTRGRVLFSESPLLSKESVLSIITTMGAVPKENPFVITLHPTAYARLKDDADIVAALEAKNGVVTLVSA